MEDEDNENGLVDIWNLWEEIYSKEAVINRPTTHVTNSNSGLDDKEENRENCFYSSYSRVSNINRSSYANIKNVILGLKESVQKQNKKSSLYGERLSQIVQSNGTNKEKKDVTKVTLENMSEYTQYLGLQPTTKSKCEKCNTQDDCRCSSNMSPHQEVNSFSESQSLDQINLPSVAVVDLLSYNYKDSNTNTLVNTQSNVSEISPVCKNEICAIASCEIQETDDSGVSPATSSMSIGNSEQACITELPLSSICDLMPEKYLDSATPHNKIAPSSEIYNSSCTEVQCTSFSDLSDNCLSQESPTFSKQFLNFNINLLPNVSGIQTSTTSSKLLNSDCLNQTLNSDNTEELQTGDKEQISVRDCTNSPINSNKILSSSSFELLFDKRLKSKLNSDEVPSTNRCNLIDDSFHQNESVNNCKRSCSSNNEINVNICCDDVSFKSQQESLIHNYEKNNDKVCTEISTSDNKKSEDSSTPKQINSKATRKVYLCAACETYFENWNLFIHMRDIHKRYICLFCLGMFGEAERLSHHLAKKHNITEMKFQSAEEFYKTFEGSCYLVCCSCEKMFSETDNFYNHYCSVKSELEDVNEQVSSDVCAVCRLVGKHLETCSLISKKSDEANLLSIQINSSKVNSVDTFAPSQKITGIRRHSTRTIKPNRLNNDVYLYTNLTNVRINRTKQSVSESEKSDCSTSDTQYSVSKSKDLEPKKSLIQNTVAKKVTEVYQCKTSSDSNQCFKNVCLSNTSRDSSCTHNSEFAENIYDSATKTIMEVSKFNNEFTGKIAMRKNSSIKPSNPKSEDDVRLREPSDGPNATKELHVVNSLNGKSNPSSESEASHSPNGHSLVNTNYKKQTFNFENIPSSKVELKLHSNLSVTPVPDRSLVIKICTKNKSTFSVSTVDTTSRINAQNEDDTRESEENNISEVSNDKYTITEKNEAIEKQFDNENKSDFDDEYKINVIDNPTEEREKNIQKMKSDLNVHISSEFNEMNFEKKLVKNNERKFEIENIEINDGMLLAGSEIPLTDINIDDLLENISVENLLKLCIHAMYASCVYCNHARLIAVNGRQLCLHMLSEHRFQPQHPAIIINCDQLIIKFKSSLESLESYYFNLDSYSSQQGTYNVTSIKMYECFHCRFYSPSHKELYIHNRKMHQKSIVICIMCKSTFYSYSELLCHLCPGIYTVNYNIQYRCCFCSLGNLPSAFRLMVHLRKQHHACDVCLETTDNQQRLSNHVWKHKLHHLCYRCGIAYRNKPDITKHLFWKHGTESVLCKKCLQKKWPHIYHFCIPPISFVCEECGSNFSKAIALKVHKRTHSSEFPYSCSECLEKFISKKLLNKHKKLHNEPLPSPQVVASSIDSCTVTRSKTCIDVYSTQSKEDISTKINIDFASIEIVKKVIDVYDLPPLNLSSDSDSEVENDKQMDVTGDSKSLDFKSEYLLNASKLNVEDAEEVVTDLVIEVDRNEEEKKQEEQVMDGIWDNFKSYTESLEKQESSVKITTDKNTKQENIYKTVDFSISSSTLRDIILADHDYCVLYSNKVEGNEIRINILTNSDCNVVEEKKNPSWERTASPKATPKHIDNSSPSKKKAKSPKKKQQNTCTSSSDSSSNSDSSSCSCRTGCSCSSSSSSNCSSSNSSSNSDSSDTESSPNKANLNLKTRKKGKEVRNVVNTKETVLENVKEDGEVITMKDQGTKINNVETVKIQIEIVESDLETTESETDEDFYDENPQQHANKLLAEKQNRLLCSSVAPVSIEQTPSNNGIVDSEYFSTSQIPQKSAKEPTVKKKVKTRNRKRGIIDKTRNQSIKLNIPKSAYQKNILKTSTARKQNKFNVPSKRSAYTDQITVSEFEISHTVGGSGSETDGKRSSKRKRVPKRFYGDSSDEEDHRLKMLKWKRFDIPLVAQSPLEATNVPHSVHEQQQLLLQQQKQEFFMQQQQQQQLLLQQEQHHQIFSQQHEQLIMQQQFQMQQEIWSEQQLSNEEQKNEIDAEQDSLVIAASSSSDSIDSEPESKMNEKGNAMSQSPILYPALYSTKSVERINNLYCYCQCPYDEVSEMIACDGDECQIEWFHFECVGITVPPKGKWYCPDCRRKLGLLNIVEDSAKG